MKLNLSKCTSWEHHRSGWRCCINSIQHLHNPNGVLVVDYLEKLMKEEVYIDQPWIGFVHNTPNHPNIISSIYGKYHDYDLIDMVNSPMWKKNTKRCLGLYCLSEYNLNFLSKFCSCPVERLFHATEVPELKFKWDKFQDNKNKLVLTIGHWMRNFQAVFDLECNLKKIILKGVDTFNYEKINEYFATNNSVSYMERKNNVEYDILLSENLVFLNLFDSSANNTVVECIARGTPIIINRLPALEEYLGIDYPLFYSNLDEASFLLKNEASLMQGHYHLKNQQYKILPETFCKNLISSNLYKLLPKVSML